ncbi:MAG: flagellar basal body-associated FliL family protein [Spirochaetaceae bacterium]|nr:flagellar basal body-associated FliL family protein [Spirochaetaceae bacterium]
MGDDVDDSDMNFAEGEAEQTAAPKAKGAGGGLLKILMIVGIALGAVILIVTVVIITVNALNKQGKPMSQVPVSEAYQQATPLYAYSTTVGEIRARTRDKEPSAVVVKINIGYDETDKDTPVEITARLYQIRDYLRNYFSLKYASELAPDQETTVKAELRENLNRMLSKPSIKEVLFEKFDVVGL